MEQNGEDIQFDLAIGGNKSHDDMDNPPSFTEFSFECLNNSEEDPNGKFKIELSSTSPNDFGLTFVDKSNIGSVDDLNDTYGHNASNKTTFTCRDNNAFSMDSSRVRINEWMEGKARNLDNKDYRNKTITIKDCDIQDLDEVRVFKNYMSKVRNCKNGLRKCSSP